MFNFFKKKQKKPENIKEVLEKLKEIDKEVKKLSQNFENFKEENKDTLQKFAIVRFNPFKEVGSNQSFSIALLDGNHNGFVITSYYEREKSRVYAKPIKNGKSQYLLSKEEQQAIDKALRS